MAVEKVEMLYVDNGEYSFGIPLRLPRMVATKGDLVDMNAPILISDSCPLTPGLHEFHYRFNYSEDPAQIGNGNYGYNHESMFIKKSGYDHYLPRRAYAVGQYLIVDCRLYKIITAFNIVNYTTYLPDVIHNLEDLDANFISYSLEEKDVGRFIFFNVNEDGTSVKQWQPDLLRNIELPPFIGIIKYVDSENLKCVIQMLPIEGSEIPMPPNDGQLYGMRDGQWEVMS